MSTTLKSISRNIPIVLAISLTAYVTIIAKANAFQILTTVDGCQVWANDNGQQLYRKSGGRMMIHMPCGTNGVAAATSEHYTSSLSGQSIIVHDITEGAIAVYQWDGGTGLVQTSRQLIGAAKRPNSQRN